MLASVVFTYVQCIGPFRCLSSPNCAERIFSQCPTSVYIIVTSCPIRLSGPSFPSFRLQIRLVLDGFYHRTINFTRTANYMCSMAVYRVYYIYNSLTFVSCDCTYMQLYTPDSRGHTFKFNCKL